MRSRKKNHHPANCRGLRENKSPTGNKSESLCPIYPRVHNRRQARRDRWRPPHASRSGRIGKVKGTSEEGALLHECQCLWEKKGFNNTQLFTADQSPRYADSVCVCAFERTPIIFILISYGWSVGLLSGHKEPFKVARRIFCMLLFCVFSETSYIKIVYKGNKRV